MDKEIEQLLEMARQESDGSSQPLELLAALDSEAFKDHLMLKKKVYSTPLIPKKYKSLLAVAVGIALDNPSCIMNNTKAAVKAGATKDEVMEAINVAKFSKSATTLPNSRLAWAWLKELEDTAQDE